MGPISSLLTLPVAGPIGALRWLALQIADSAWQEMLDPARIEVALRNLEQRLEAGQLTEAGFEIEEIKLLEELSRIRAIRAGETDLQSETESADTGPDSDPESSNSEGL